MMPHVDRSRWRTSARLVPVAVMALLALGATPAQADWITSWSVAPVRPMPSLGKFMPAPSFKNRTLKQVVRVSAGGTALRLRLSNAYGTQPLEIGGARIAILDKDGREVAGSARTLHFAGQDAASIPPGAPLLSDTVGLDVPDLARLSVTLYLPGETGPCTCHSPGLDEMQVSPEGDYLGKDFAPEQTLPFRAFLSAVEVDGADGAQTIAVLGDSISDGVGSTMSANHRWPDLFADRLSAEAKGQWGVANQGISGNRVLSDGMGDSALARFDRDILALPGVKYLIVFEGVNDLGMGFGHFGDAGATMNALPRTTVNLDTMLAGYRQIVARAHDKGIKVIGATISPYKGSAYWSEAGEKLRQQINAAIRSGQIFDGMLDFDKAFRDPDHPDEMRPGYHLGDHLHGSDAGYEAVARSIDLTLFK